MNTMKSKLHELVIVLKRDGQGTNWGIRLVGGCDLSSPFIITRVQLGSPAHGELMRDDIVTKINEYDARDLTHADAQMLFRTAGNQIRVVVHRGDWNVQQKNAYNSQTSKPRQRPLEHASSESQIVQRSLLSNLLDQAQGQTYAAATARPHSVMGKPSGYTSGPPFVYDTTSRHSMQQSYPPKQMLRPAVVGVTSSSSCIDEQPYRTTPLVLPGAKVKKDAPTTESYLKHYPNPAVRAPPGHDYHDSVMKQRVADTMLHKVVGPDAESGRVFHKQFNSPIGLYSEGNIENTIRQTVPVQPVRKSAPNRPLPTKLDGYKRTVVFDPSKSETFKAIQEEDNAAPGVVQEVTVPIQSKAYQPNKMIPGKRPLSAAPVSRTTFNVVNTHDETIRQSGSFNRLMYSVLGATDY